MKIAWTTDVHLNFVEDEPRRAFLETLGQAVNAVLITGDIAESPEIVGYLEEIECRVEVPVYFVLGNHDFYRGDVCSTRRRVADWSRDRSTLTYLTDHDLVRLAPGVALVGHDGWADARLGDWESSDVVLSDYALIDELRFWKDFGELDKGPLAAALQALADDAAATIERRLEQAVRAHDRILVATHVPPFREATWHEGRISDDQWLPHFSSRAMGDALVRVAARHPGVRIDVYCGHTHGAGTAIIRENLVVRTGGATYGRPAVVDRLEIATA